MPPPAEASTRMSAISSCIFFCICSAFCIMACMFPGSFIVPALFFQTSHHAELRVREHLLEALHIGVCQRALGDIVLLFGNWRRRFRSAQSDFDPHGTAV